MKPIKPACLGVIGLLAYVPVAHAGSITSATSQLLGASLVFSSGGLDPNSIAVGSASNSLSQFIGADGILSTDTNGAILFRSDGSSAIATTADPGSTGVSFPQFGDVTVTLPLTLAASTNAAVATGSNLTSQADAMDSYTIIFKTLPNTALGIFGSIVANVGEVAGDQLTETVHSQATGELIFNNLTNGTSITQTFVDTALDVPQVGQEPSLILPFLDRLIDVGPIASFVELKFVLTAESKATDVVDNGTGGTQPIDEPGSLTVLGVGLLGLGLVAWRRRFS